uniref:Uncharacterized protein n=1 Tax=Neobacillus citreus TaxID=2833578 RepID=A0A942Y8F9_9BACI
MVAIALAALQSTRHWTGTGPLRSAVAIALTALAVGLLVSACVPKQSAPSSSTVNGRQVRPDRILAPRDSVQEYLGRRPRDVLPRGRDAVLADTPRLQRGLVSRLVVTTPVVTALACGGAIGPLLGEVRVFVVLWPVLYLCTLPDLVLRIGRAERARLSALATDEPPVRQRYGDGLPSGSKLGLPGD